MKIRDYMEEIAILIVDFSEIIILNTFTNGNRKTINVDNENELLLKYGDLIFSRAVFEYNSDNDTAILTFIIKY